MNEENNRDFFKIEVKVINTIVKDNKRFSLNINKDITKLRKSTFCFCKDELSDILNTDDIIFLNQRHKKRKSHRILIIDTRVDKSKSISVNLRDYSSQMIAQKIKEYIIGEQI